MSGSGGPRVAGIGALLAGHARRSRLRLLCCGDLDGSATARQLVARGLTADCAVIVISANAGLSELTRRHTLLVARLRIPRVVVAIDGMERVDFSQARFRGLEREFAALATRLGLTTGQIPCVPVSALRGENVLGRGTHTTWYAGPPLIQCVAPAVDPDPASEPLRLAVESADGTGPGRCQAIGTVVSGAVSLGDEVVVAPGARRATAVALSGPAGPMDRASAGETVTVSMDSDAPLVRGDLVGAASSPPQAADLLQATIIWTHDRPLLPGRTYLVQAGPRAVTATIAPLRYKLSADSSDRVAATTLARDEIGVCDLKLSAPIAFDPHAENRVTGTVAVLDRLTEEVLGAGLIEFALYRGRNLTWQRHDVGAPARAAALGQAPFVLWLTGLPGAGKSTIANRVESELHRRGHHTYLLDGDNVRQGLNRDLGFTDADRVENIRRVAEVAKLMTDAGLVVIVSFISPFASERRMARGLFAPGRFVEVHVDAPLEVAQRRDPKGLYGQARRGEVRNVTGVDSRYEPPERPEIWLDTATLSVKEATAAVIDRLVADGLVTTAVTPPGR
ncbi:MAG TPA: adenylyl-sulfate kinase [Solirubrobacteraceae bacterium]|jgi:bifunctional enzyme CysN/CysC|nr:adenylyl-sulfate kinase [Solirubrobacteraceae bacterium]